MYKEIKIKLNADKIKEFIKITNSFKSDVDVISDKICIDGKSILGIHALDLSKEIHVRIITDDVVERRNFEAKMEEFR